MIQPLGYRYRGAGWPSWRDRVRQRHQITHSAGGPQPKARGPCARCILTALPERVSGLVLRGIFLCRAREIQWFYQEGASRVFPDLWEDYLSVIPEAERNDLVSAYYRRLTGGDELGRLSAARAWAVWEGRTATLMPSHDVVDHFGDPYVALSLARIECHYFMHDSFLEPDQILRAAGRLHGIPGVIVQGRYDMVCPAESAWALHHAWPQAALHIVADAGHSAIEPGIIDALVQATDAFAERLGSTPGTVS